MAIEDIIQIKESVKENPLGDPQTVNQAEFLRFQEQMGLGVDGIMAKIIQMFVEAPSDFTRQFGVEAADAVREFLGNQTQRELEGQGRVFAPDSAEIIGQKTSFRPDQSAIGTLPTDQADQSEGLSWIKQIQDTLGEIPESATSVLRAAKEEKGGLGSIWETIKDKLGWQKWGRGDKENFEWFHGEELDLEDENFRNFIKQRWMEEGDTFLDGVEKWKKDVERIIKTGELED